MTHEWEDFTNPEYLKYRNKLLSLDDFLNRVRKGFDFKEKWLEKRIAKAKKQAERRAERVKNNLPIRPSETDTYGT